MPTVLYVSQPTITGVAQCVLDWTSGLSQRGWDVALACPTDGWLGMACAREGVRTFAWEAVRQPYVGVRRETTRLRQIMNIVRPDVVHLQGSKAGLSGRLLLRGSIPTAFSPHSWSFEAADGAIGAAALRWERVATRWTDVVVAVSEAECADGLANGIDVPYVVARNGIDTTAVAPLAEADRETLRAELGIAPGTTAVVCLGRLHRQKGQDVLLAAWPAAAAPGRQLYLVGDGPLYDEWTAEPPAVLAAEGIELVGGVERADALRWLAAADLVVMPSRWEGMALVPLESLAVGTPVIASDVTGASEAVAADCGAVVPPGDPAALAAGINAWLGQPADALAAARLAARTRVVGKFELSQTVDIIDATLTALAEQR